MTALQSVHAEDVTLEEWAAEVEAMRSAGAYGGRSEASWLVDGNTSEETARAILKQFEDGDPAAPSPSYPFSGEWADGPDVRNCIEDSTSLDYDSLTPEEVEELTTAFEEAYVDAWHEEAERNVRAILS